MPDLAQICAQCKAEQEKSKLAYLDELERLQAENEQLKADCQKWATARPVVLELSNSEAVTRLLDLLESDIARQEMVKWDEGSHVPLVIAAYRELRGK